MFLKQLLYSSERLLLPLLVVALLPVAVPSVAHLLVALLPVAVLSAAEGFFAVLSVAGPSVAVPHSLWQNLKKPSTPLQSI